MNILLTGATGYIGKRILPALAKDGHHIYCGTRDIQRLSVPEAFADQITVLEMDLLNAESLKSIPYSIDVAFYLVHSMASSGNYQKMEQLSAENFRMAIERTCVQQVIYLGGIVNEDKLSQHLESRKNVENELRKGKYNLTVLRAGIIIGSGSASFEIIRDIVEKLPVMITPKWLNTKCQPIGISDVICYLKACIQNAKTFNQNFDIGGPDILTYKEMLLEYAHVRKLNRYIFTVPVMTPKLSSYWLYFVTSTSFKLAASLVDSMKVEVVCKDNRIREIIKTETLTYRKALKRAFNKIQNNEIVSSWKDSFSSGDLAYNISDFITVPSYGCFRDNRSLKIKDISYTIERIFGIGGSNGWYYGNWMWQLRGFMDKLVGGVGLRRGRTSPDKLFAGDAVDFWRVLYANEEEGRLLLFAEMKLPGEAWLEFRIKGDKLFQNATFRPHGITGRLYWYAVLPFHGFVFNGMIKSLIHK